MKLVFMGTPDFCLPILDELNRAGHIINMVVTQPDAPVGRKQVLTPPPAKKWAIEHGIEVYQPTRIRDEEAEKKLGEIEADAFVVAAFGQILPKEILDMPKYGCINVHASLLPKYRGAAPIQWAIINGDEYTGITIMQMGTGLDDGDILLQKKTKIQDDDTGESLFLKLAKLGGSAITEALSLLEEGSIKAVPQNHDMATKVGKIDKETGRIHFSESARSIERRVRGLYPWPGTFAMLNGQRLKILLVRVVSEAELEQYGLDVSGGENAAYGQFVMISKKSWIVKCGKDYLDILKVQPVGKKPMTAQDFLRGHTLNQGELFDNE